MILIDAHYVADVKLYVVEMHFMLIGQQKPGL